MLVRHKNPSFSGSAVAATTRFVFQAGVAEVDELSASKIAVLATKGWSVEESEAEQLDPVESAAAFSEALKPKGKPKRDFEIGETVGADDMEKPEPEIG